MSLYLGFNAVLNGSRHYYKRCIKFIGGSLVVLGILSKGLRNYSRANKAACNARGVNLDSSGYSILGNFVGNS